MASEGVAAGVAQQSIGQGIRIERLRALLRHVSALPYQNSLTVHLPAVPSTKILAQNTGVSSLQVQILLFAFRLRFDRLLRRP